MQPMGIRVAAHNLPPVIDPAGVIGIKHDEMVRGRGNRLATANDHTEHEQENNGYPSHTHAS